VSRQAPRGAADSVLYQVVRDHDEAFAARAAVWRDREGLPPFIDKEFRGSCGVAGSRAALSPRAAAAGWRNDPRGVGIPRRHPFWVDGVSVEDADQGRLGVDGRGGNDQKQDTRRRALNHGHNCSSDRTPEPNPASLIVEVHMLKALILPGGLLLVAAAVYFHA